MPISYAIQANIVQLATDSPRPSDTFLVDTNVWFWTTYTRAGLSSQPPRPYQLASYPAYPLSANIV